MYKRKFLLVLFAVLFFSMPSCYGAFPVKKASIESCVVLKAKADLPILLNEARNGKHLSFVQRAKLKVALKLAKRTGVGNQAPENNNTLSILSFCLALGGDITGVAMIAAAVAGSATGFFLFLLLAGLMGVAALILGIIALAKKQKLKGLAIAGIALSSVVAVEFVISLIAVLIAAIVGVSVI